MTSERWKHSKTTVYNIVFRLIWCSKYRRKVLENEIETRLKEFLLEKSDEIGITIEKNGNYARPHTSFVKSSPTMIPHWIVQQLKGYTLRMLIQEFLKLRTRLPTLWTRSYYYEFVDHISEETVKKYIEDQKINNTHLQNQTSS